MAVYIYMAFAELRNMQRDGGPEHSFVMSRGNIARPLGISRDTLDRYVKKFVDLGLVEVKRTRDGKLNRPNRWTLLLPSEGGRTAAATRTAADFAACPGQTTAVQVQTGAAPQPVVATVQFDNSGEVRGRTQLPIAANSRDIAAATAPPGATQVTVGLYPPPGAMVRSARIGTVGPLGSSACSNRHVCGSRSRG